MSRTYQPVQIHVYGRVDAINQRLSLPDTAAILHRCNPGRLSGLIHQNITCPYKNTGRAVGLTRLHADRDILPVDPRSAATEHPRDQCPPSDETGHLRAGGPIIDILRRADLQKTPLIHHRHLVGKRHGLALIMGDVECRSPGVFVKGVQFLLHLVAQMRVKIGKRFVHQDGARIPGQTARKRHALTLPPRQLLRLAIREICKRNRVEMPPRMLLSSRSTQASGPVRKSDISQNSHMWPKRIRLENHPHPPGFRRDMQPYPGHGPAVQNDVTGIRHLQPGDQPKQCALATAGWPHNGEKLIALHTE